MALPGAPPPPEPAGSGSAPPPAARVVVRVDAELAELIDEFLANRRVDARVIPELLGDGDYESVWRRGHNLKGVGAAYGFTFLTELGEQLESAAQSPDPEAVRRCVAALEDYLARLDVQVDER